MTIIKGKRIYLKSLNVKDVSRDYVRWMNDPDVNRYLESRYVKQTRKSVNEYVRSFLGKTNKMLFGIFMKENGSHIGNISFSDINNIHKYGVIGICIGRKEYWGKGLGVEALSLLIKFGKKHLKLCRFEAGAYAANKGSIRIFEKAGFKIEGLQKKKYFTGNKYVDGILLGLNT